MRESFENYLTRKRNSYGSQFDSSDLIPEFIKYFESGERVKVEWKFGDKYTEVLTGTIGITTGYKPVFLLMRTKKSIGSPYVIYKDECRIVAVKKGNKYVEVV